MKKITPHPSRRQFLKTSIALGGLTVLPASIVLGNRSSSDLVGPNERVNLAVVGIGHQGRNDLKRMTDSGLCNVVALCDVDLKGGHTREMQAKHPSAKTFTDFRKMFDAMANEIDAVLIATPDHSHFAATMLAMSLGKHVYVEKPLAHTYGQCARLMRLAESSGVVTQMGNQGHSGANYFQFKAWREAGIIKDITSITAHMNKNRRWHGWGEAVTEYPQDPMPDGIDWDQWHDVVAAERPFSKRLHPQEWRSWFEFGSGAFGDWGPHILDTCHRFLELGLPHTITAVSRQGTNPLVFPQASTIRFDFSARGPDLPACAVTWYDGQRNLPKIEERYRDRMTDPKTGKLITLNHPGKVLFSKDLIFKGGSHSSALQILPREKFKEMRPSLPSFPQKNSNHYKNFLLACKGEEVSRSPFSVSGPLTQVFNLGVIAQRLGGELKFDSRYQRITNNATAQVLIDPTPRKGWEEFYRL